MNTPERISVRYKFRVMLICFAIYAAITGISFYYLVKNYDEIDQAYKAEINLKNNLSEIRNLQYELFNLYSTTRDKEKEDTLVSDINLLCIGINNGIATIDQTIPDKSRKMEQSISVFREEFENYRKKINEITETKSYIRSLSDAGGRLDVSRRAASTTGNQFSISGTNNIFQEAYKYEQSFLETSNIEDYKNFNKKIDALLRILKSTGNNTPNMLVRYQISKMTDQIVEYRTTFNLIFAKQLQLGLNNNDGFKGEANAQIKTMQIDIEEMLDESNELRNDKHYSLVSKIVIIQVVTIIAGLIFFLLLFQSVTKPNERMSEYLNTLLEGKLVPPTKNYGSTNEIDIMAEQLSLFVENLKEKQLFTESIGNGRLEKDFKLLSENDELGNSLRNMKNNLEKQIKEQLERRKADELQDKINLGLTEFGAILRKNNNNLDRLCDETTRNLIKYMAANYGAMYIYEDDNPDDIHLEMKAAYAADRQKFMQKRISLYEGIVGTCAVEKTMFLIEDIPDNYIKIGSGFGDTKPRHLLVMPLLLNNKIYGMIELCRTDKFEDYRIKFIQQLSEDIAITISYVRENTKNLYKLREIGKRLEQYTINLQNAEIETKNKNNEIKALKEENKKLKEENSKLADFKLATENRLGRKLD